MGWVGWNFAIGKQNHHAYFLAPQILIQTYLPIYIAQRSHPARRIGTPYTCAPKIKRSPKVGRHENLYLFLSWVGILVHYFGSSMQLNSLPDLS